MTTVYTTLRHQMHGGGRHGRYKTTHGKARTGVNRNGPDRDSNYNTAGAEESRA